MATKEFTVCLHLAAFGCEQCKAIIKQEIEKERARCLRLISDRWNWGRDAVSKMIREPE